MIYHKYIDEKFLDCEPKKIANSALSWDGFLRCKQSLNGEFDWLLLGDSHAEHLFLGLAQENPEVNLAYYIFGAPPYVDQEQFKEIFEVISKINNPKKIFLQCIMLVELIIRLNLKENLLKQLIS